jgi:hypothetical protein
MHIRNKRLELIIIKQIFINGTVFKIVGTYGEC